MHVSNWVFPLAAVVGAVMGFLGFNLETRKLRFAITGLGALIAVGAIVGGMYDDYLADEANLGPVRTEAASQLAAAREWQAIRVMTGAERSVECSGRPAASPNSVLTTTLPQGLPEEHMVRQGTFLMASHQSDDWVVTNTDFSIRSLTKEDLRAVIQGCVATLNAKLPGALTYAQKSQSTW